MTVSRSCLIAFCILATPFLLLFGCATALRLRAEGTPEFRIEWTEVTAAGRQSHSVLEMPSERIGRLTKRIRGLPAGVQLEVGPFSGKLAPRFEYEVHRVHGPAVAIGDGSREETLAVLLLDPERSWVFYGPYSGRPLDGVEGGAGFWKPFDSNARCLWFEGTSGRLEMPGGDGVERRPLVQVQSESGWLIDFDVSYPVTPGELVRVETADGSPHDLRVVVAAREGEGVAQRSNWVVHVRDAERVVLTVRGWPVRSLRDMPQMRLVKL